jgi:hypothetical protein
LTRLNLSQVELISLEEFEADDEALLQAKRNRSIIEYYWTCTASLPLYILRRYPVVGIIAYLDADLYFYADPKPIYSELGAGSIMIIEHRYSVEYAHLKSTSGIYNVGLLVFRNDAIGVACLTWWRERCLEWCYVRKEDGKFGDQKYLDDWLYRFDGVVVLQHKGAGIAPWNMAHYDMKWNDGHITVDGVPLLFCHFHDFKSIYSNTFQPASYAYKLSIFQIESLFMPYGQTLQALERDIRGLESGNAVYGYHGHGNYSGNRWWNVMLGLLEQRWFLLSPKWFALALWRFGEAQHNRLLKGSYAFRCNDRSTTRRQLLLFVLRNPLVLRHKPVVSMLVKTILSQKQYSQVRQLWKRP